MYYILYEGLQIESNEPVYCTVYSIQAMYSLGDIVTGISIYIYGRWN